MRNILTLSIVSGFMVLGGKVADAAPAPGDKPVRYEYAELRWTRYYIPAPAAPGQKAPLAPNPLIAVRWTTATEELELKGWEELADRLKAPAPKKESPPTVHKLRVLNVLSADGWELLDKPGPEPRDENVWTFRRRVP
jgi:hypothetical protein